MEGLSRGDAIEWFKVCDKATLVLERFVESTATTHDPQQPTTQSQLSSFEGVSCKIFKIFKEIVQVKYNLQQDDKVQ